MKPPLTLLACAIALTSWLGASSAIAIPTQVGGFTQSVGMRLEDFLQLENTWQQDTKLKGKWQTWDDPAVTDRGIELLKLSLSAVVFGVPANEVTVQRRDGRAVQFNVIFKPTSKLDASQLDRAVRTNAAAWASSNSGGESSLETGATAITWASGKDGAIVAIFSPRTDSTPS